MTGTRQLHFFLCPWCLLLEDLYYMAGLTNIFLMHFFSRNNIFFQYLSNIFFVSIWTEVIWIALGVLLIEYWSADWHYGAQWKSIIIATSLYNSTRNWCALCSNAAWYFWAPRTYHNPLHTCLQQYILNIAKGTTDPRHWVLIEHHQYKAEASTSLEILVKLQLGFVLQKARNT